MISIEHVSKSYVKEKKSVDDLSLEVRDGEIFGFLGPNGAGKSTTIHMITGILEPDEGTIRIDGHDIIKDALSAKRQFGYVPDSPDLFLNLKGIEYLNFLADIYHVEGREGRITELTKKFEVYDVLNDQMQSYSHGMRQKTLICGALLHQPKNWILDEPMVGLDPKSAFDLKEMMRTHADGGNTVFFSTHALEVAEKVCDRVAVISKGKLLFVGTLEELRASFREEGSLEELFLEMTENA